MPCSLSRPDQSRASRLGPFLPICRFDNLAHKFGRELGAFVSELDAHGLPINCRQLMA